jgi:hypothetical protein
MKEETKKGIIVRKSFIGKDVCKLTEEGTGKSYYFYQLNSESAFPVGTPVEYTLISFTDSDHPILKDIKRP